MWARTAEPSVGTARESHLATGSSIPEVHTIIFGAHVPEAGDGHVAE